MWRAIRFGFNSGFDVIERIEILHFAGDPALEIAGIKKGDRPDATAAGQERFPKRVEPDTIGGHDAHSGDNDSISLIHDLEGSRMSYGELMKQSSF